MGSAITRLYSLDEDQIVSLPTPHTIKQHHEKRGRVLPFLKKGRLTDARAAGYFLSEALKREFRRPLAITRPKIAAAVPSCFSQVEKLALYKALFHAGAGGAQLVATAVAAASGAGVDLSSHHATVMLACGKSVGELAVVVSGSQVTSQELSLTLDDLVGDLSMGLEQTLSISLPEESIAKLLALHSPFQESTESKKDHILPGKNLATGKLEDCQVPQALIAEMSRAFFATQVETIEAALNSMPSVMATDLVDQGIILYGGMASMKGLSLFLSQNLSVPVSSAPEPHMTVINGLKDMISSISFQENDEDLLSAPVLGC